MTSTNTSLTVVLQLTVPAERVYTVGAQLAEAIRSAAELPGLQMTVHGAAPAPELVPPTRLRREPPVRILCAQRRVLRDGQNVPLTRLEYDLLLFLCRNPGQVHRRDALMATVWKLSAPYRTRTIDVHIRRLRRKLGDDLPLINTVRGVGYRVDDVDLVRIDEEPPVRQSA